MPRLALEPWLFGKLPAHGDFISRGLSNSAKTRMDLWLSEEMVQARKVHGEAFDALFDEAPPWRFARRMEAGVICPSTDAVGRRFPILAGLPLKDASHARSAALSCEETIYRAFKEHLTVEELYQLLHEAAPVSGTPIEDTGWWLEDGKNFLAGCFPDGLLSQMLTVVAP